MQIVGSVEENGTRTGALRRAIDSDLEGAFFDEDHLLVGMAVRRMRHFAWTDRGHVPFEIIEREGGRIKELAPLAGFGRFDGQFGPINHCGFGHGFRCFGGIETPDNWDYKAPEKGWNFHSQKAGVGN